MIKTPRVALKKLLTVGISLISSATCMEKMSDLNDKTYYSETIAQDLSSIVEKQGNIINNYACWEIYEKYYEKLLGKKCGTKFIEFVKEKIKIESELFIPMSLQNSKEHFSRFRENLQLPKIVVDNACISTVDILDYLLNNKEAIDKDTIIVFDCDNVLLSENRLTKYSEEDLNQFFTKALDILVDGNRSKECIEVVQNIITNYLFNEESPIVNPNMLLVMKFCQEKNAKTLVLSNATSDKIFDSMNFDSFPYFTELRAEVLKRKGFNFSDCWNGYSCTGTKNTKSEAKCEKLSLDEKSSFLIKSDISPITDWCRFYKGVITTGSKMVKGDALISFLSHCYDNNGNIYYPKKLIFIDDNIRNIGSMVNVCNITNINFTGFHFCEVDFNQYGYHRKYDSKKVEMNLQLIKHGVCPF